VNPITKLQFLIELTDKQEYQVRNILLAEELDSKLFCPNKAKMNKETHVFYFKVPQPNLRQIELNQETTFRQLQINSFEFHGVNWYSNTEGRTCLENGDKMYVLNEKMNVELVILCILSPNSTIIPEVMQYEFEYHCPGFETSELPIINNKIFFTNKHKQLHFVTCAPVESSGWLSLSGYVSAFDNYVWLMIIWTAALSGIAIHLYEHLEQFVLKSGGEMQNIGTENLYQNLTFVFNVLIAQGAPIVSKHKLICGAWIMVGIVLTYGYQGKN